MARAKIRHLTLLSKPEQRRRRCFSIDCGVVQRATSRLSSTGRAAAEGP
jgi:hypothetical protein